MSSTNRGSERANGDYYRTPSWCVEAIAPYIAGPWRTVVDPGCGDGAIGAGLRASGWETPIVGVEIDQNLRRAALCTGHYHDALPGDYLTWTSGSLCQLLAGPSDRTIVVGNPPYSLAMEFVERSMELADTVAMLLRLPWAASAGRRAFHQANPSDLFVLSKRPSFCTSNKCGNKRGRGCGHKWTCPSGQRPECPKCGVDGVAVSRTDTDSCDYAWFVWSPFSSGRWCVL